jgi:hypothetical protein
MFSDTVREAPTVNGRPTGAEQAQDDLNPQIFIHQ